MNVRELRQKHRGNMNKKNMDRLARIHDTQPNKRYWRDRYGTSSCKNGSKPKHIRRGACHAYDNPYPEYIKYGEIPNSEDIIYGLDDDYTAEDMRRLRYKLNKKDYGSSYLNPDLRDPHVRKWYGGPGDDDLTMDELYSNNAASPNYYAVTRSICTPNSNPANNHIHHFTEEYYLSYITKHYDFSLTHNDLLSIEKNHISIVVDKLCKYFESVDKKLALEHIELIDHNIYKNKYFVFSFSKVFIKAKMHINTNPKKVFTTELVAFSKYPYNPKLGKMISDVSKIVYDSLREQDLDINIRLIDLKSEPENEMVFTRIYGNQSDVYTTDITVKNMKLTNEFYPYLDIELLKSEYLLSNSRLLLLYGENGSGKTKLSNLLSLHLQDNSYDIIIISGSDIQYESIVAKMESKLFSKTSDSKNVCIVIDDLDPKFLNRDHGDKVNTFFTKLLTIIDGNLDCELKVIITTNHILREDQDDPLYRNGRLFDSIYIRYLTQDEAKAILKANKVDAKSIKSFLDKHGESIKQADVAEAISNKKKGITKSYYKDKKIETNIIRKRIGFKE